MDTSKVLSTLYAEQNNLIESIYKTAIDFSHWQHFMQQIVKAIDGRSARMLFMNGSANEVYASTMAHTDENYLQQYVDYYVNTCPWRPELIKKPKGRMYSSFLDFSNGQKDFHKGQFYSDWAKPQNIEHGMGGNVVCRADTTIQFLIQRSKEPGPFTREETSFMDTLLPHLRQSLQLNQQLEANRLLTQAISQASQISPLPFVLLDERLQICHMSRQAEDILTTHPLIGIKNQQLICREASRQQQLQRILLQTSLSFQQGEWCHCGGQLTLSQAQGETLELLCYPLHDQFSTTQSSGKPFSAVFLNLQRWFRFDNLRLKSQFALTDAEILLAESLFNGMSLQEHADRRGTSFHTARTQCKKLLTKLSVSRQAALTRALLPYLSR
jgi:DNA-binding CsgD family transcriptional regulator